MAKVMAVNAGSSSLKFKLFEMPEEKVICSGLVGRIGKEDAEFKFVLNDQKEEKVLPVLTYTYAVELVLKTLLEKGVVKHLEEIQGVGHRIVQGGKYFNDSVKFDDDVEKKVEELISLAPLHNGAHLIGLRAIKEALPHVGNVAVFDTAFHQTMEPQDYMFPVPYEWYEKYDIRRYGAHGTSHKYLSHEGMKFVDKKENVRMITCHLGSGASITAIRDGKCVATSMGLTPLGGIMMGTRCGDIDPSVVTYACEKTGMTPEQMFQTLNKQSGLKGFSGVDDDSRNVLKAMREGNKRAELAIDLWVRRVVDYIGQYYVRLGGCDLLVFSAGVGENDGYLRQRVVDGIAEALGVKLKPEQLTIRGEEAVLSTDDSKIKVVLIPTDEELMIARDTCRILNIK